MGFAFVLFILRLLLIVEVISLRSVRRFASSLQLTRAEFSQMKNIIVATFGIIIGGLIYILWRSENLLMFVWFDYLNLTETIFDLRHVTSNYKNSFPSWFYYSLPTALWTFSGTLLFLTIWSGNFLYEKTIWVSIFLIFSFGFEIGQFLGFVAGTFDVKDIFLSGIFVILAVIIYNLNNKGVESDAEKTFFISLPVVFSVSLRSGKFGVWF